jgi:hypothetical protein
MRSFKEAKKQYLLELIHFTGSDRKLMCEISGLSKITMFRSLKKFDLLGEAKRIRDETNRPRRPVQAPAQNPGHLVEDANQ